VLFWLSVIVSIGLIYLRIANWMDEKSDYNKALENIQCRRAELDLLEGIKSESTTDAVEQNNLEDERENHD